MANQPWTNPAKPLKDLARAFGLEENALAPHEWPNELKFYAKLAFASVIEAFPSDERGKAEKLEHLDRVLKALIDKYGSLVTFHIKTGDLEILSLDTYGSQLIDIYKALDRKLDLVLDLRIGKKDLLTNWGFSHKTATFKMFLFPSALERVLAVPLPSLEEDDRGLLSDFTGETKLIILVPDREVLLHGDYLVILGGAMVGDWEKYLPAQQPEVTKERISSILNQVKDNPLRHLTPLQLQVDWKNDATLAPNRNDAIPKALSTQLASCSLFYLTNKSRSDHSKKSHLAWESAEFPWVFTFSADKYSTKVEVKKTDEIAEAINSTSIGPPWLAAQTLGEMADWIYNEDGGVRNRRKIVQVAITDALQGNEPAKNLQRLIEKAPDIYARVKELWETFMKDRLDEYFLRRHELEQTVKLTTDSHNDQIQSLTKTLTDNMLAAVGVVVGSFIAAIFKSPFETYIFWIGTGVYLAYLIVFPIGVGLVSARQRFKNSQISFQTSENEFIQLLGVDDVKKIVGSTVKNSEKRFANWFAFTTLTYAVVVLLLLSAIWKIPNEIRKWGDNFEAADVAYSQPVTSEVVPLLIHGSNFDKEKEIVVRIGDLAFTNTDGETLKVHGSTVLTLSPKQKELLRAKMNNSWFLTVKQGTAEEKKLALPNGAAPIPHPVFEKWITAKGKVKGIEVDGTNLGSILQVSLDGAKVEFTVSNNGNRLELTSDSAPKSPWGGKTLAMTLKNGESMRVIIPSTASNSGDGK
jgi:hypothetical protein